MCPLMSLIACSVMQVAVQAQSATGREKAALEARAQKAKTKLDAAKEKADAVEKAPLPKVEVRFRGVACCIQLLNASCILVHTKPTAYYFMHACNK